MVHTRSAVKKVDSGQVHNDERMVTQDTPVDQLAKKCRPEGTTAAPKKRQRGKQPGEICQLNLDVLFLVR